MKTRTLISALVVTLGVSSAANAAPSGLDNVLSRLVSSAISITAEEIKNEVTESVLNASHHTDVEEVKTRVEVTDLNTSDTKED